MHSHEMKIWIPNGSPRTSDRAGMVTMAISLLVLAVFIYLAGGSLLLGSGFLALALVAFTVGALGHFRRRPFRIGLFPLEIQAEFRRGECARSRGHTGTERGCARTRVGDVTVDLHLTSGGWEGRIHI